MGEQKFRESLSRLMALIAIQDAQIMANPKPYLEDMSRRCNELLEVLEKVEYALSPDVVFDFWNDSCDKYYFKGPQDINGEALIRCNAALDVIRKYKEQ